MSTPFLYQFSVAIVSRLVEREQLEIRPGAEEKVLNFVSGSLAAARPGSSVISTFFAALLACPEVEEVYADEAEIKEIVDDLAP